MEKFLIVGAGGFFGAMCRYLVAGWAADRFGGLFPFGTLIVNIVGSFLLALFITLSVERLLISPAWRLFLAIGFLGAFTTFSTFAWETDSLIRDAEWLAAAVNILGNVLAALTAVKLGTVLAKLL